MSALDDIVQITITRNSQTVSRRAFGWALVLGSHTKFLDRLVWVDQSDWATTLAAYGFASSDAIYDAVQRYFGQTPCPTKVAVGRIGAGETIAVALAACLGADADWYGLILCSKTLQDQKDAMDWIEANERIFIASVWDSNVINQTAADDNTSLAYYCKANSLTRSGVMYTRNSLYPEAAWFGRCLPGDPGTIDWAHKTLALVTVDVLSATQRKNAHDKYCSTYETIGGLAKTEEGWTGNADFLDVRQAIDWLTSTLKEDIFALLSSVDKLPFTDAGIKAVEAVIRRVLQHATDIGILAPFDPDQGDYLKLPAAADISTADKAARRLNCGKCFQRRLSGSLHHVIVQGNLTV